MGIDHIKMKIYDPIKGMDEVSDHLAIGIYDLCCAADKAGKPATLTFVMRCEVKGRHARVELHRDLLIEVEK